MNKTQVHDGIVGAVVLVTTLLGMNGNPALLYVPVVIGALLVSSAFTGFCPVYFILNKVMK